MSLLDAGRGVALAIIVTIAMHIPG